MGYRIGLDIGVASIGWAMVLLDDEGVPYRIGDLGVRIFNAAEHPKTGSSLSAPRREARSMRRRLRRHKHRLDRIKLLIEQSGIMLRTEIIEMYSSKLQPDVYQLRAEALDRVLSSEELVRVLIHLAQRRGFKSNRKKQTSDNETGLLKKAVEQNKLLLKEGNYRTIGEMLYMDKRYQFKCDYEDNTIIRRQTRNKSEDYTNTFSREMLQEEIAEIFSRQRALSSQYATETFEKKYTTIVLSQRGFDEGPGAGSPYAGDLIEQMIGTCTFETGEKRAVKASYTYERFMLLTKLIALRIRKSDGQYVSLSDEERRKLEEAAYTHKELKYTQIRKILSLDEEDRFKGLVYGWKKEVNKVEEATLVKLPAYHSIKQALKDCLYNNEPYYNTLSSDLLDSIGYVFTVYKQDERIEKELKEIGIYAPAIPKLMSLSFSKTGNLSVKAMKKIINYLEKGMDYDKACEAAGYNFLGHGSQIKKDLLPPMDFEQVTNPVVKRALSQSVKVINAIILKYGQPDSINIELAREMSRTFSERNKDRKSMEDNKTRNDKIRSELINTIGLHAPKGDDIVRLKLYQEQDGWCFYSGEKLELPRVFFEPGYADIDHIIPYSISFDDSYKNKVLVLSSENRQKGNRLPYEYLSENSEVLDKYIVLIESIKTISTQKRNNLLKKKLVDEEAAEFKDRSLVDTRYITRVLANHIRDYLKFSEAPHMKQKRVISVNGPVTAYMRKRWGLSKIREQGDLHHALDAVVIACVDDKMIQKVSRYHKMKETIFSGKPEYIDTETGEVLNLEQYDVKYFISDNKRFPLPWHNFRNEVEARLSKNPQEIIRSLKLQTYGSNEEVRPIFVSRTPKRKNTGQGHLDTIRSPRMKSDSLAISKTPIEKLKLDKNGEIEGYYNPQSDRLLYDALRNQLKANNNDAKEAFKNPFYKPTSNGHSGPIVKRVKVFDKMNLGVDVLGGKGIANNGDMIRIDVFVKDLKYYWIPIYASDTILEVLPNRAVLAAKPYSEWTIIENAYNFLFSLYPNDLIYFEHKSGVRVKTVTGKNYQIESGFMYYVSADTSDASIKVISHDNEFQISSLGVKTLKKLEKYNVDYLGNVTKVKKESRQDYKKKRGG